ncbi:hypothetical protein [Halalkalibacter flavus]|uniref:hypothetical protein n=1 Tax=Halalkalibacter flavus TaxID=3090668 RepID=UPI002FC93FD5
MNIWIGKIKGHNADGEYIGTYRAVISKEGHFLFKMTLHFDGTNNSSKKPYKKVEFISSNVNVLKRKFRMSLPTKEKEKILWIKKLNEISRSEGNKNGRHSNRANE